MECRLVQIPLAQFLSHREMFLAHRDDTLDAQRAVFADNQEAELARLAGLLRDGWEVVGVPVLVPTPHCHFLVYVLWGVELPPTQADQKKGNGDGRR